MDLFLKNVFKVKKYEDVVKSCKKLDCSEFAGDESLFLGIVGDYLPGKKVDSLKDLKRKAPKAYDRVVESSAALLMFLKLSTQPKPAPGVSIDHYHVTDTLKVQFFHEFGSVVSNEFERIKKISDSNIKPNDKISLTFFLNCVDRFALIVDKHAYPGYLQSGLFKMVLERPKVEIDEEDYMDTYSDPYKKS